MSKIVPSERLRRELGEVVAGVAEHDDPVEAVARVGARLIMQQAFEDEVTEFLGRGRYQRAGEGGAIYRNGYEPTTVKTTSGAMELERPRIRGVSELEFEGQVLGKGVARTHALEALIILGFLRAVGVRRRGAARGGARRADRRQVDGGADLPRHPGALSRVV